MWFLSLLWWLFSWAVTAIAVAIIVISIILLFMQKLYEKVVSILPLITWETRGNIIKISAVLRSNFFSFNILKRKNYLTDKDGFPTPYYYTKPSNGRQPITLFLKQLKVAMIPQKATLYEKADDSSYQMLDAFGMTDEMTPDEIANCNIIMKNTKSTNAYDFTMESMFGELIINAENPYAIKHLKQARDGPAALYQKALFDALKKKEPLDETVLSQVDLGFDFSKLHEEIRNSKSRLYVLDLEDLRSVYSEEPYTNTVRIQTLKQAKHVATNIQFPYAVFVRAKNRDGMEGFICIAAVFRYTKSNSYLTLSPFFSKVSKCPKIWQMVRCHIAHEHFNDFTFKTHLGVLHLISSQYNVPLYNYLKYTKDKIGREKLQKFFQYAFEPFNSGLEGVNTSAFKTLIHPDYPLVSNVFSVPTERALKVIGIQSKRINLNKYTARELATQNGLQEMIKPESESGISFDVRTQDILDHYIQEIYRLCGIDKYEKEILEEINKTIQPATHRDTKITDLCALFCNLAFCWVTYHSHTFSNLSLASYFRFKPSIMCRELPLDEKEWEGINEDEYLPNPKMLMEACKMNKSVTLRDGGNILTDTFARLSFKAKKKGDEIYSALLQKTMTDLRKVGEDLDKVNKKRMENNLFGMVWQHPERMQASLNI